MSKKKKNIKKKDPLKQKKSFIKSIGTKRFWYKALIYLIVLCFIVTGVLTGLAGMGAF